MCKKCGRGCESECMALKELLTIWNENRVKEKHQLIRKLRKTLNLLDAEPSKQMKQLADLIINKFPELYFIKEYGIKIGYVLSQERKQGQKITYADCRKVNLVYSAYIPYDFVITFYADNIEMLNENQKKILMLHELKHIGVNQKGLVIIPHDVEDFESILKDYGTKWNKYNNNDVPDILEVNNNE